MAENMASPHTQATVAPPPDQERSPSPLSQAPSLLPDRSIPDQPLDGQTKAEQPAFIPAWRRPTIAVNGEMIRRPSVQFVPHVKTAGSRSSSAKASSTRKPLFHSSPYHAASSTGNRRLSSPPPPAQFRHSVSFDTFSNPSASDFSLTLNRKHRDYEYTKRSRTFLCGTDTNEYSDTALEWLIDELVDDGDEVVCLRVVEKDSREAVKWSGGQGEKGYRKEAARFLEAIEKKNTEGKAISLVLEFSIGKINDTIQQMIRIYEPAILVVGTRGRSLTGYQGLLSSGSVSKYCLQYSPVPVIVVRPSSKREAKKRKRMQDPERRGYRDILDKSEDAPRGRGGHLLDERNRSSVTGSDLGLLGDLGSGDPEEEARKVAEAIGYRGDIGGSEQGRGSPLARVASGQSNASARSTEDLTSPDGRLLKSPEMRNMDSPMPSDEEDEADEADGEPGGLQECWRPEDEALQLAYERAQKAAQEEREEAEARAQRERERAERSMSRGARSRSRPRTDSNEEGGGAAVLDLLAKLDRGIK